MTTRRAHSKEKMMDLPAEQVDIKGLVEAISTLKESISKLNDAVSDLKDMVDEKFKAVELQLTKLTTENNEQRGLIKTHETRINELELQIQANSKHIATLVNHAEKDEARSRAYNLRIIGIDEAEREDTLKIASKSLVQRKLVSSEEEASCMIENVHRTGVKKGSKPRHLILRLHKRLDAQRIIKEARRSNQEHAIKVVPDRTTKELSLRKQAMPQLIKAWKEGKKAGINYKQQLIIDGQVTPISSD